MPLADKPDDDFERICALHELKILDTPPEERFDRISRMALQVLDVPVAYVSLIDGERQWFKSVCGLNFNSTPRGPSLCAHTILSYEPIICPDTHLEPRFADSPYVVGDPHVRFYLGHPIATPEGYRVGTFCALGFEPRLVTPKERAAFSDLAAMAEAELNLMDLITLQKELRSKKADLEKRNLFIREVFGRFVTDQVAESLLDCPKGLKLGGERRNLSILMSDLRGFTALSERLSPEHMVSLINLYLAKMIPVVESFHGTIDEFIGDAILVLFGAPLPAENHAEQAVACALAMQLALQDLNVEFVAQGLPELTMGIGVHTGDAIVGNIGSDRRMKYGVVGSAVNLTARIQSFTLGGQTLVSEATYRAVQSIARADGHLRVKVKGYDQPISIYEIGGLRGRYQLEVPEPEHFQPHHPVEALQ